MHELPVVETILETVLRHAQNYNAIRIKTIFLEIGCLSDLEDEWMQHYFDYVSKGSLAHGARLSIERIAIGLKCRACSHSYSVETVDDIDVPCPACGKQKKSELVSGHDYFIKNMEIQMPEPGAAE